jgi:hypothetical protein
MDSVWAELGAILSSVVVMHSILKMTDSETKSFAKDVGNPLDLLYCVEVMLNGMMGGTYAENPKINGLSFENNPAFLERSVSKVIGGYYTWVDDGRWSGNEIGYEIRFHSILFYGGADYIEQEWPSIATLVEEQYKMPFNRFVSSAVADVTIGGWEATQDVSGINSMTIMHVAGNLVPNWFASSIHKNHYR